MNLRQKYKRIKKENERLKKKRSPNGSAAYFGIERM